MHEIFKALGDPLRLRILNLLRQGELCVCDIEATLGATQSNVSRHLAKLRSEGMVSTRKSAQWIYYQVDEDFYREHGALLQYLWNKMSQREEYKQDLVQLRKHLLSKNCE